MSTGKKLPLMVAGIIVIAALLLVLSGMSGYFTLPGVVPGNGTFTQTADAIELQGGKPVIRLFSTTWCPHCTWIKDTYENTVQEYVAQGKIVAYHWEIDILDDTLTPGIEGTFPDSELAVYKKFNPKGSIPTFVFGGKYFRVGNGYESTNNLALEEQEFRQIIESLIEEAQKAQ